MNRLKALAKAVNTWQKNRQNQLLESKKKIIEEIEQVDKFEADNQMKETLHLKRLSLKADLSKIKLNQTQL